MLISNLLFIPRSITEVKPGENKIVENISGKIVYIKVYFKLEDYGTYVTFKNQELNFETIGRTPKTFWLDQMITSPKLEVIGTNFDRNSSKFIEYEILIKEEI